MNAAVILAPLVLLAGCAVQEASPEAAAQADQRLADATRGLVPGEPQACIPSIGLRGPTQIDPSTLIYRTGSNRVWINRLAQPCPGLDPLRTIVVVRPVAGSNLCANDTFTLVDRNAGFPRGTCSFGRFIPYRKPDAGARE